MNDESGTFYVSMAENRMLREIVHDVTSGIFLKRSEFAEIMNIIGNAVKRELKNENN